MVDNINKKLQELERKAGSNAFKFFIIENGKIMSEGREYTKEQYEKHKNKLTIIDDIPDKLEEADNEKNK